MQNEYLFNSKGQEAFKILDNFDVLIYISDIETYEIIYMNKFAKKIYGDNKGSICWEKFQKKPKGICSFCTNERLLNNNNEPTEVHIWEFNNQYNEKWYEVHDSAIVWNNRLVKLHMAIDISNKKRDESSLLQYITLHEIYFDISRILNRASNFELNLHEILSILGEKIDVSRVSIFINSTDMKRTKKSYQWNKQGTNLRKNISINIENIDLYKWFDITNEKRVLNVLNIKTDLPHEIAKQIDPSIVKSLLIAPIYIDKKLFGFLCFEQCDFERKWKYHEIRIIRTCSNLISEAFKRNNYENEIIDSEKRLKIANASKDKFFSIIAHDLKTPLSNIEGLAELLFINYSKWDEEKIARFIKHLHNAAKRGYNLLENLLEWARSQTGRIEWNPSRTDIKKLIIETIDIVSDNALKKQILINTENVDNKFVYIDINMITTVIRNLLSNAIKFSNIGDTIKIETKLINKKYLQVSVIDTGVGISNDDKNKLFRIDITHSTRGTSDETGTGLGLILCKEFVEKNNGKIWIESQKGKGSTFNFTIPLDFEQSVNYTKLA